jgi:hypothetical protein
MMNIEDKIRAVSEKIDSHKSLIGHILVRDDSIGIDYLDPVEMEMVDSFVLTQQEKIVFLEGLLEDLKNGIDQLG